MSDLNRYPAEVFWSDDDEGFIAIAPDLPGCSAFGEDESQAIAELRHAIAAWKEAATAAGNPIPPPSRPAEAEYSGKFVVRMAKTLHRQLAVSADREGVSLNQYVCTLLASAHSLSVIEERIANGWAIANETLGVEVRQSTASSRMSVCGTVAGNPQFIEKSLLTGTSSLVGGAVSDLWHRRLSDS
jgi:predicted RNase H-like HicB family nuclease